MRVGTIISFLNQLLNSLFLAEEEDDDEEEENFVEGTFEFKDFTKRLQNRILVSLNYL